MNHPIQQHKTFLNELCRVCGKTALTQLERKQKRKTLACNEYKGEILLLFNIDIGKDLEDRHSKSLCYKCVKRIKNMKTYKGENFLNTSRLLAKSSQHLWTEYVSNDISGCNVCQTKFKISRGCIKDVPTMEGDSDNRNNNEMIKTPNSSYTDTPTTSIFEHATDTDTSFQTHETPFTSTPIKAKPQTKDFATSPIFKTDIQPAVIVKTPMTRDTTEVDEKVHTDFIRKKLSESKDHIIKLKTKGQPMYLMKIQKHRTPSSDVTSPTRRKRSKAITQFRRHISGTSQDALQAQQSHELKKNPLPTRRNICQKAGITTNTNMQTCFALAMKETVGLSWSQERTLRQFLKSSGIKIPNEHKQREEIKNITENGLQINSKPFIDSSGKATDTPLVKIRNLTDYVTKTLDKVEDKLTWYDGSIPNNEIWIKIGGDHGKGSFKLSMAIVNIPNPNSKHNHIMVAMARTRDSRENLELFFEDIKPQLYDLDLLQWKGKRIRLFLFGDYDFLTKMTGLSGACGAHPCLWCFVRKKDIQSAEASEAPLRKWSHLFRDYHRFMEHGNGLKKNAHCFNNSIHAPILDIPLPRICPPYLHCLLGITLRHHKLLENMVDKLDRYLFEEGENQNEDVQLFQKYGRNWIQHKHLKERLEKYNTSLILSDCEHDKKDFRRKIETIESEMSCLQKEDPVERCGPIGSTLDNILNANSITPQFYHSRSFIGNHCHKYFTKKVYEQLTDNIIKTTSSYTSNNDALEFANNIRDVFDHINEAFAEIHILISHTKQLSDNDLQNIHRAIEHYMVLYRSYFPQKVLPKHHILEHHCFPFTNRFRFGLGLLGEQGGESLHSIIGKIEKRTQSMRHEPTQLMTIMTNSLLQVSPELQSQLPFKKRKFDENTK